MKLFWFTKDLFYLKFRDLSENIFAIFLGMFLETASYVARGPSD